MKKIIEITSLMLQKEDKKLLKELKWKRIRIENVKTYNYVWNSVMKCLKAP